MMMAMAPTPAAGLNHRGEHMAALPLQSRPKSRLARKLSTMESESEASGLSDDYMLHPLKKKQRSGSFGSDAFGLRRQTSLGLEREPTDTPFDLHLQAVYDGRADMLDGLEFFESHGYYDVSDANTVEMFRQNFGLDAFWVDPEDEEEDALATVNTLGSGVYPFGSQCRVTSTRALLRRERTNSGRFTLLDDDGNEVDEESLLELEREDRLRVKSLELDADDLAELEQEQQTMVQAITVIRSEKSEFQRYFFQVFHEEEARTVRIQAPVLMHAQRTELPPAMPPADLELPPYCGYVNVLKDTIPFLLRSWRKRWFYLDFQAGVVLMYKRSYWKSPRGVIDLRSVSHVEKMSRGDFRVEFRDTGADAPPMMLLRAKVKEEAELWVNLLRFAQQQTRRSPSRVMDNALVASAQTSMKKHKKESKKNQVDILAQMLNNSAHTAPSSNLRAIAAASASAAMAVSQRRQGHHGNGRHVGALTA